MIDPRRLAPLKDGDPTMAGRFELLGRLGVGGMGVAFFARSNDVAAVVKMIQLDFADDPEARRRFRREVLAASAVETPFVPEVLASDVSAERQWVAMEYLDGSTLEQLIRSDGPLTAPQQRALAAALAAALSDMHQHGLIHRDLKPSNVISTSTGPRIIDFGVAVLETLPNLTKTGTLAPGSPGWMSPEQLDPYATPTSAVDVFSWGCLCWYAATGSSPFGGKSVEERVATLRGWAGPASVPAELDEALVPLVVRALAATPSERPSAAELALALAADGKTVSLTEVHEPWLKPGPSSTAGSAGRDSHDLPTAAASTQHSLVNTRTTELASVGGAPRDGHRRRTLLIIAACFLGLAAAGVIAVAFSLFSVEQPPPSVTDTADASEGPAANPAGTPSSSTTASDTPAKPSKEATQATRPPQSDRPSASATAPTSPADSTPEFLADYGGDERVGYGNVKLGMRLDELLASGDTLAVDSNPSGCTDYPLKAGGTATYSSMQGRVVYITFAGQMATSKGVMVGSTETAAAQAYPDQTYDAYGQMTVPVADGVSYLIASDGSGYVSTLALLSRAQDCAG